QTRRDFPPVGEIKPLFRLPEVKEAPIILVREKGRQTEQQRSKPVAGKRRRSIVVRRIERRPSAVEIVRSLSLLAFDDVIPLTAIFTAELDGVLALVPGDVVFKYAARQSFILAIIRIPGEPIVSERGPAFGSKRIGGTQPARPVGEVSQRARTLVRTMHADQQFVDQRGSERVGLRNGDVVELGIAS